MSAPSFMLGALAGVTTTILVACPRQRVEPPIDLTPTEETLRLASPTEGCEPDCLAPTQETTGLIRPNTEEEDDDPAP